LPAFRILIKRRRIVTHIGGNLTIAVKVASATPNPANKAFGAAEPPLFSQRRLPRRHHENCRVPTFRDGKYQY